MSNDVAINVSVRDLTGPGFNSVNRNINQLQRNADNAAGHVDRLGGELDGLTQSASGAASALGKGGSGGLGLTSTLYGVAGVLGTAAAPAIGALVPMLAGLGAAGGVVALSFKDIKKEAKDLKPAFKDLQAVASKAVMPGVKSAVKDLKVALKDLQPTVKVAGKSVSEFARDAGRFAKSPAFQGALLKNVQMGSRWFNEFGDSVFKLTQSLLDFGTQSQPTLDALGGGLNDLIGSGLPDFFRALEPGIEGSAAMFRGLFDAVDRLLVSLGGFSASFSKNLGPLLGEMLRYASDLASSLLDGLAPALDALGPLADSATRALQSMGMATEPLGKGIGGILAGAIKLVTPVFQNLLDLSAIAIPVILDLASAIVGPLLSAFTEVTNADDGISDLNQGLADFGNWVHDNRPAIEGAFRSMAVAILDLVTVTIDAAPDIFNAFRMISEAALNMSEVIVTGIALALAPIPGIGKKAIQAASDFRRFKADVSESMDGAAGKITEFRDSALPKLKGARLELETSSFDRGLMAAGQAIRNTNLDKTAHIKGDKKQFDQAAAAVRAARMAVKSVTVKANTAPFWGGLAGIANRVVAAAYVTVGGVASGRAHRASGGVVNGPGTSTSDSIPAMLSDGEFVVNAAATKRNRGLLEAINAGTLRGFARGGMSDAMRQARSDAKSQLTVSYFGQRAGYTRSEAVNQLGRADSLGDLVHSLNKWRSLIKAATSGATESRLLKSLTATANGLIRNEKALTKVNAQLDKAKDKLSSLKDAAAQLSSQVASGILAGGNITGAAGGEGQVTTTGILGRLRGSTDQAKAFASALTALRKKGLNAQSLSEIAQAGVEGGGLETANALLGASSSEIKEINSLEAQLKKSAKEAGKVTADAMYGAGIHAAEGMVKGLQKKQDALEKVMEKAATAFARQVKKALGISGKASGGIVGAASGGARGGLTWVGEQGPELVRMPYGSMVYPAGQSRQMAMAGGGGGRAVYELVVNLDGRTVARQIFDPLRNEIRSRGGAARALPQ